MGSDAYFRVKEEDVFEEVWDIVGRQRVATVAVWVCARRNGVEVRGRGGAGREKFSHARQTTGRGRMMG